MGPNDTAGLQKILLVEDDVFISDLYESFLRKNGYTVMVAADGEKALEAVKTFQPELIFLDIMMPKMDGLEVLKILRSDASYGCMTCKIVMLTNLGDNTIADRLVGQINGYAVKADIDLDDLLKIIRSLGPSAPPPSIAA